MRYKVRGLEIRSENAAKPTAKPAAPLTQWLEEMAPVHAALDYGCGKLRYSGVLASQCRILTLVDSEVQLNREQKVGGTTTTIRTYAQERWPRCRVLNINEFWGEQRTYDFVLCANVLSAIPNKQIRSKVLFKISSILARTGRSLFVAQYQNSYFKEVAASPNAIRHLDGWVLKTSRGAFYFGVLNRDRLVRLVMKHNFVIETAWVQGQSAYVLARRAIST